MSQWNGKSKGNVIGYRIFLTTIKYFGVSCAYLILKIVTFYYFLFAKKTRKPIEEFYLNSLKFPKKKASSITKKNFYYFGQTLVDRSAFLLNKGDKFTYTFNNEQPVVHLANVNF